MQIINPATEEVICEIAEDNMEMLTLKYRLLKEAQPSWAAFGLKKRAEIIKVFSELLAIKIEELSQVLTKEVGKPLQQSRNEINGAITRINWLSGNAEKYLSEEIMSETPELAEKISYEPLGIICNISAWNYPWLVGVNVFVSALLAGNAVMYKPSEYALLTGLEIEKLLVEAGVPTDVFKLALGGASVGEFLLTLPLDGYFFTGSYKTGKHIYERCASKMVPCNLEMGGKDPLYIADDITDIKKVAAATADGAFYNNGQSCCSVERIYIHERIYDKYISAFQNEVSSWKLGDPGEPGVYFGPVTRKEQLEVLNHQVSDAVAKGAHILTGGMRPNRKGYFFEPTILVRVSHEMELMMEESFGPVIGIMKVQNDEEALMLMADTKYGLTASVYSANRKRAEKILYQLNTGSAYWNCCDRVSACLPWSGRKHSGFGIALSHAGLRAFTKPKAFHLRD